MTKPAAASFPLSRAQNRGRAAFIGTSVVRTGATRAGVPRRRATSPASSNQVAWPELTQ
jgi:hypothetical protein